LADTLIQNAGLVLTMDKIRRVVPSGDVLMRDGRIVAVGRDLPATGCTVVNAEGCLVTPGLVNTHHHLYQTMTRAVPAGQDAALFDWLQALYRIWAAMRPDDFFVSAQVGMAELLLSGCTTTSDHLYLYPNGTRLEDTIHAAQEIGMRFHPTRGAMSIGESAGGLPPDDLVEQEADILEDTIRVIDGFHDPRPAPCAELELPPARLFRSAAN